MRIGEEETRQAVLEHRAKLILLADDAGESTSQRVKRLETDRLPVLILPESKAELGAAVGFAAVSAIAVCDLGFAAAVAKKLMEQDDRIGCVADKLKARQEKAARRKAETNKYGKKSAGRRR